jgi:hypothetical protein
MTTEVTVATPSGPVTFTGQETPEARQAAISKAFNVVPPKAPERMSVAHHWDATSRTMVTADATAAPAKAPPAPKALEKQNAMPPQGNPSPARQAELDAEQQAAGLQKRPDGSTHADGEVDTEALEKLTARYRELHKVLISRQDKGEARSEKEADMRAAYERDLLRIHTGRPRSELELGLGTGEVVTNARKSKETAPVSAHPPEAWAEAHTTVADKEGMIPLERINTAGLSGYKLPKFIEDQTYHVSIFQDLANARKQGISQKQIDGFIRAGMIEQGWIKA